MTFSISDILESSSHIATVVGALPILGGYYYFSRLRKKKRVENYLRNELELGKDKGQRSVTHVASKLKMSEVDVMRVANSSARITIKTTIDNRGFADKQLLAYEPR
jgi:hypothetical protein